MKTPWGGGSFGKNAGTRGGTEEEYVDLVVWRVTFSKPSHFLVFME